MGGRNGTKPAVFPVMARFISLNAGKVVSIKDLLVGQELGRNSHTSYLYKFIKAGYVKPINQNGASVSIKNENAMYEIVKQIPAHFTSSMLDREVKIASGLIPDTCRTENLLNRGK